MYAPDREALVRLKDYVLKSILSPGENLGLIVHSQQQHSGFRNMRIEPHGSCSLFAADVGVVSVLRLARVRWPPLRHTFATSGTGKKLPFSEVVDVEKR